MGHAESQLSRHVCDEPSCARWRSVARASRFDPVTHEFKELPASNRSIIMRARCRAYVVVRLWSLRKDSLKCAFGASPLESWRCR